MTEGEKTTIEEEKNTMEDAINGPPESKLDKRVLADVCLGIISVFGLMIIVNSIIAKNISDLKTAYYMSIVASNLLFISVILAIKAGKRLKWSELGWKRAKLKASVKDIFKIWGLTWLIHIVYMMIIVYMGITPEENELVELLEKPSLLILIANIILIAVAAPFIEETLFRGLLFGSLRTYLGCWTAIIISAAIFSALHFELVGFVPRFILGIGLGYLYVKHDSIYPAIGLHALNNFFAVIIVSLFS